MSIEGISSLVDITGPPRRTLHYRRYGPTDAEWHHSQTRSASSPSPPASSSPPPPLLVCVHGAGMSSMSFGPCASIISEATSFEEHLFACRVVSLDLRCHGESSTTSSLGVDDGEVLDETTLTRDNLVKDFVAFVSHIKSTLFPETERLYYAGHSLGGAIVSFGACHPDLVHFLGGVVMLDIVEAAAKQSLKFMPTVLDKRPLAFQSPRTAAHWFVTQGGMMNEPIAQLTVPYLLREVPAQGEEPVKYVWRTNLRKTVDCWASWFEGLDEAFIGLKCPKMLLLATTDRLDKDLTTAHMQGKFQLEVIGTPGHFVMEDEPTVVSSKLMHFIHRVDQLSAKLAKINHSIRR